MKFLLPALFAAALAAPFAVVAAPATIEPGYWESTNRVLSPIRQTTTEMRCITPADVEKFMMGPSNRHYTCTYPTKSFQGGKIHLKGTCVSKGGRQVAVSGDGAYSRDAFQLTADIATEFAGLNIAGRASTEARRVADACPKPTDAPATQSAPGTPAGR